MAERNQKPARAAARSKRKAGPPSPPVPVVGVGVGAVSLESLAALFQGFEPDLGAAYLVAVRQADGVTVATVAEKLRGASALPVVAAADGAAMLANHIYIGGPDDMISITDGHL